MARGLVASARVNIAAPISTVWDALVNPEVVKQYMFGTDVISEWKKGSRITWKGVWQGRAYEDKGKILELDAGRLISYSHYSPLSGLPDAPENYHVVTIELSTKGSGTAVSLSQDNNPTEEARRHSQRNWEAMLLSLKNLLEGRPQRR
jgi:uncharacterized protein YndB with AHSA1/START domain